MEAFIRAGITVYSYPWIPMIEDSYVMYSTCICVSRLPPVSFYRVYRKGVRFVWGLWGFGRLKCETSLSLVSAL